MNKRIYIKLDKLDSMVKQEIIKNNLCNGIFPVSTINYGIHELTSFDVDGYVKLKDVESLSSIQALKVLTLFLQNVDALKEYLFYPNRYVISRETVYINLDFNRIKFILIPCKKGERDEQAYENMIFYLFELTEKRGKEYLKKAWKYLKGNPTYPKFVAYVDELIAEIKLFETA